jgi:hypothetical protein
MWPDRFDNRLKQWSYLRQQAQQNDLEQALKDINLWWAQCPWTSFYLHPDDIENWPDPWQLLSDNIYCDLARALGIVYTIKLLGRNDIHDIELVQTDEYYNLVYICKRKYILNYSDDVVLNTCQPEMKITKTINLDQIDSIKNLR